METRQIHVKDLSTVTGIMQYEHEVQSIYFLGLEDFEGTIYLSIESDQYSNEAVPLSNNTFVIGQPMTLYNVTYTCQIYGVLNDGEKIQLSKRFRLMIDKSNDIQGDSSEYPIDPNFENSIIEFVNEQKTELDTYTESQKSEIQSTGSAVIASIPSDYTALEQATYNAYPTQSETGNPIYVDDGADDIPVKELIVNLEPKQEGSGDPSPSNVRPISGFDGVKVKRTGKNLLPLTPRTVTVSGVTATVNDNGIISLSGTASADNFIVFQENISLAKGTYCLKEFTAQGVSDYAGTRSQVIQFRPDNYITIPWNSANNYVVGNLDGGDSYVYRARVKSGVNYNGVTLSPMLTVGTEIPSTFESFNQSDEYSITFPSSVGTVYGGTLNVTTGELVVDRAFGSTTWGAMASSTTVGTTTRRRLALNGADTNKVTHLCNVAPYVSGGYNTDKGNRWYSDGTNCFLYLTTGTSDDLVVQFCIELATPITYQLTPTEVTTLLGSNTIQSDGSMELEYRADTTKVIEKLTNAIVSLGGNV